MYRYVAFLRGINVGGHIILKAQLQEVFSSLGFHKVSTHKQSGNVIFEAATDDTEEIKRNIERKLFATLGYEVPVFLRTPQQLEDIISQDPFRGCERVGASFLVTFFGNRPNISLAVPLTIPKSTAQVILFQGTEAFSVTHGGGEGALPNPYLEKTLKTKATTRNLRVIKEIIEKITSNSH